MQSWAEGSGSATLASSDGSGTIALSGGTGTAVLVNHGAGTNDANVPFGRFVSPYGDSRCADYIDAFVLPGASDGWTLDLPLYSTPAACPSIDELFRFNFDNDPVDDNHDAPCQGIPGQWGCYWDTVPAVTNTSGALQVSSLTASELQGTPFAAGDTAGRDPTNVTLVHFTLAATEAGVRLVWETAVESDVSGFFIQRRDGEAWVRISAFIPAAGDSGMGWHYAYVDAARIAESIYRLEVVNTNQSSEFHLPDESDISDAQANQANKAVYLPLVIR